MPGYIHKPGTIGIVSKSGTLTYEAVHQVTSIGMGQFHLHRDRGRPDQRDELHRRAFRIPGRSETEAVIMIGEIGGTAEEEAAAFVKAKMTKPVVGFVAGQTAPKGKRMATPAPSSPEERNGGREDRGVQGGGDLRFRDALRHGEDPRPASWAES